MITRRAGIAALIGLGIPAQAIAQAAARGQLTIAFPADVPTWDPNARSLAGVQSLYKCVFDQPLDQAPDLSVAPALVTKWATWTTAACRLGWTCEMTRCSTPGRG